MSDDTDGEPCHSQDKDKSICRYKRIAFFSAHIPYFCVWIHKKRHSCVFSREDAVMSFCAFCIV